MARGVPPLRAMAHPVRLRILSLTTGAAMSAVEIAHELGIAHATASYHARKLADAGLLQVVDAAGARVGRGRPPVRYRYVASLRSRLDRSDGTDALWSATAQDIARCLRARTRHRVGAAAEVWMAPADFERVCVLAEKISALIHERARPAGTAGAMHGSVTVLAFELARGR